MVNLFVKIKIEDSTKFKQMIGSLITLITSHETSDMIKSKAMKILRKISVFKYNPEL